MKLLCPLILLAANALCAFAALPIPLPPLNVPLDLVPDYFKLFKLCNNGGDNSYVGVLYQDGSYVTYNFGQCYPYELSDGTTLAKMAVFCKTSTCFNNPVLFLVSHCGGSAIGIRIARAELCHLFPFLFQSLSLW
ncbi:hypothetical protein GALMADRAFT_1326777 [Galerina marginata CBS 339.88]|uniref:Cyanovirin-N domain-containing protein n=1 Tax=Galerina marginata (strain CBS 339.88) TaxID=685588 RepID=A0A067T3V3_GALM3|nr:hypothetical protein GALMADRAFT_1326777 [Galerina marginata CBS 339.88]